MISRGNASAARFHVNPDAETDSHRYEGCGVSVN